MNAKTAKRSGDAGPRLLTLILLASAVFPAGVDASVIYRAGPNTGSTPQTHQNSSNWGASLVIGQFYQQSESGPSGLKSELGLGSYTLDNYFTGITVSDVIVTSTDPGATEAYIGFGGLLSGSFTGSGNGTAIMGLTIMGLGIGTTQAGASFTSTVSDAPVYVYANVPLDQPLTVSALLELRGASAFQQTFILDFLNSFDFDPFSVFDVGPGVTVSSASWGLVNNQLPDFLPGDPTDVPEPASITLFFAGLAALRLLRRQSTRSS